MNKAFSIYHLNLAYSSIPTEDRILVIEKCYFPLLDVIESMSMPVGIELSGWTLVQINKMAPQWIHRFCSLIDSGLCELIGSGFTQLIAPLVPYDVNQWNQELGMQKYSEILNIRPNLAMVNEMAYSTGLVELYYKAGYQGIILDNANISYDRTVNKYLPSFAKGLNSCELPVLWTDTTLFQKFQRYVHGDIVLNEYIDYVRKYADSNAELSIYCNDAEIFDYRPGRYLEESTIHYQGEWRRILGLYDSISTSLNSKWMLPSQIIKDRQKHEYTKSQYLTSASVPIPTKKQAKYNIGRWAITGRNDLWLNTICHRLTNSLLTEPTMNTPENREKICQLWSSDYRTHITEERWLDVKRDVAEFSHVTNTCKAFDKPIKTQISAQLIKESVVRQSSHDYSVKLDHDQMYLNINTETIQLCLNLRRGLAIKSLGFRSQAFVPVIGTIPQGFFDTIDLAMDFYSGHVIVELPTRHKRVTDLEKVSPTVDYTSDSIIVCIELSTIMGKLIKQFKIDKKQEIVELSTRLINWQRCHNIVRVGSMTLLPNAFDHPISISCKNGGNKPEKFQLDQACLHHMPVSTLVSYRSGYGATDGSIIIGDSKTCVQYSWDPSECAAFPMLHYQPTASSFLARVTFSLSEIDETYIPGGQLPSFRFTIKPSDVVMDR